MKSANEIAVNGKDRHDAAKAIAAKPAKRAAPRGAERAATGASRAQAKRTSPVPRTPASGYGDTANRLIARGKAAFGGAYAWAGEAGTALPHATRDLRLPDHRMVQGYVAERPLILGAIGLGIGMAIGAMLPAAAHPAKPTPRKTRRK